MPIPKTIFKKLSKHQDKDWLYQKYIVERLSARKVAKICNYNHVTILKWLKIHNIKTRTKSKAQKGRIGYWRGKKRSKESILKTRLALTGRKGKPPWNKGKTGVYSKETLRKMRNSNRFFNKKVPGEKSWRWKGGKEGYYRDIGRRVWENWWNQIIPPKYGIHHIDGNVKNNDMTNLVIMTQSQHATLHHAKRHNEKNL